MEKELIRQKTINYVQYSEYRLLDVSPDTNGEYRTELRIILMKSSVPVDSLITQWTDANADRSIFDFTRVVITFGFPVKPIDEMGSYLDQDVYSIDLNTIEDIGELSTVWVENSNYEYKVGLFVNLDEDFDNLEYLRIVGCDLKYGLEVGNKNGLVVEMVSCDINEGIQQYENRDGKKNTVYCMLTACTFYNLRGLNFNHIKLLSMKDCNLESAFESGEDQMIDNLVPALLFKNSDQIIIENLFVRTILTGFEFDNIDNLRVCGFTGKEPVIDETIKNSMIARNCKEVTFTCIKVPGVTADKCENVNISNVVIGKTVSQNAKFGVKVSRCVGKISISGIDCEWNTVKTAVAISLCKVDEDNQISICDCNFKKLKNGISLNTNSGNINICNCSFKDMDIDATGLNVKTHAGFIKVIDSQFGHINGGNFIGLCENLDFVDCSFGGDLSAREDVTDLKISESGTIRFVSCDIQSSHIEISNSVSTNFKKSLVKTNIIKLSGSDLSFEDSQISSNHNSSFTTGGSLNLRYSSFEGFTPEFDNYNAVTIDDCVFKKGLKLTTCGTPGSYIKECDFGDSDDLKSFTKGILAIGCTGIEMKNNVFNSDESKTVTILELTRCSSCIFDQTNSYKNKSGILITDWSKDSTSGINNNHIIVDSASENRPSVSSTNNFRYMLFIFNRKVYDSQYSGVPAYSNLDDVIGLRLNTISVVDFSEQWVAPYIKRLNSALKTALNQIS